MSTLNFGNPWILALLWLVPLAAVTLAALRARRKRKEAALVSPALQAKMLPGRSDWRFRAQLALVSVALAGALLALAQPRWGEMSQTVTRRGRDLLIVLDVSRSMLAADVMPTRLDRAKADLIDLVHSLEGDRAGLILFRHKAVQVCPLTTDYAFLLQMLDAAGPDSAPPGETDIGDALLKALNALEGGESAHQAIVLVSDGEDLAETVEDAVAKAKERNIVVFTVGFGSLTGAAVPGEEGGTYEYQGKAVTSRMNPSTLRTIASKTGGVFLPVGTARADLGELYRRHLRSRAERDLEETVVRRQVERFTWFLLPAILCWLAACALSAGRPLLRKAALVILLLAAGGVSAESTNTVPRDPLGLARSAQAEYRKGNHAKAADLYKQAAGLDASRNAARHWYNAGCALLEAGRFTEAAEAFRSSETLRMDPAIPSAYNQGVALARGAEAGDAWKTNAAAAQARADQLAAAVRSFQRGLDLADSPARESAAKNLAAAAAKADEAREHARTVKIAETYGKMDAAQLAGQLLEKQRRLGPEIGNALSNSPPDQIRKLEALGREQQEAVEMMAPLSAKMEQAAAQDGTNAAKRAAELRQFTGALAGMLRESAERLRDADPSAREMLPAQERASYQLWKKVAPDDMVLREDIRVESNLVEAAKTEAAGFIPAQEEAERLTRLFSERFAAAIPPEGQPAMQPQGPVKDGGASTNQQGITAETRKKILDLAGQAAAMQGDAVKAGKEKDWPAAGVLARDSLKKLKEIEDLLPKQNQQQQQQQDQQQPQDQKDQPKDQPRDPKDQQQDQQQQPDQQKPEQPKDQQKPDKETMSEDQARQLLEKAKQREKEYLDEKRKKAFFDRAPGERDW